jgi:glucose-6-phosphate isomerase
MKLFDPGLDVRPQTDPLGFEYGERVFGPKPENRSLEAIRKSLRDPNCAGPDPVYSIVMDVGCEEHRSILQSHMLLFGVVTYAAGRLGEEPVRSQGHVHKVSSHSGWRPPELYEIWRGRAIIYMQEFAQEAPGRCFAVTANPGDTVLVPPGWAHATISADPTQPLTFGAWCDREYGFEYDDVRRLGGLAFFPLLDHDNRITWQHNSNYGRCDLIEKRPSSYAQFGLDATTPIYRQFAEAHSRFDFIPKPDRCAALWEKFVP